MGAPSDGAYVYVPPTTSPFYRHCLSPLCDLLCKLFIPKFVHPDCLTVFGVICAASSAYCAFTGQWIACGLLWMTYSLMDNMDGKQARRTGKSSPGGEFLDHSCDAIVTTLSCLVWEKALLVGSLLRLRKFYMPINGQFPYFTSTWAHSILGRLILGTSFDGSVDMLTVDEFNFFILPGFAFIRAFFPWVWESRIDTHIAAFAASAPHDVISQLHESVVPFITEPVIEKVQLGVKVFNQYFVQFFGDAAFDGGYNLGVLIMVPSTIIVFLQLINLVLHTVRPSNLHTFFPLVIYTGLVYHFDLPHLTVLGPFCQMIMEQIAYRLGIHKSVLKLYWPLAPLAALAVYCPEGNEHYNYIIGGYLAVCALHANYYRVGLNNGINKIKKE